MIASESLVLEKNTWYHVTVCQQIIIIIVIIITIIELE